MGRAVLALRRAAGATWRPFYLRSCRDERHPKLLGMAQAWLGSMLGALGEDILKPPRWPLDHFELHLPREPGGE